MTEAGDRSQCVTQKVKSPFGSLYAHVEFKPLREPPWIQAVGVWFSTPGKHEDTNLDRVIRSLNLNCRIAGGRISRPSTVERDPRVGEALAALLGAADAILAEAGESRGECER